MERKEFVKIIGAGILSASALSLILESCSKEESSATDPKVSGFTVDLADPANSSLKMDKGFIHKNKVIVINNAGNYIALSDVCTHEDCTVDFNGSVLPCPCHGSQFNLEGKVLKGPAIRALTKYNVSRNGDVLTIS